MNSLDQLRQHTTVVADTGDFDQLAQFTPQDATTNPSLVLKAVQQPRYRALLEQAVATHPGASVTAVAEHLLVAFGVEILKVVPGRVSTEIDPRLSHDTAASVTTARRLIQLYAAANVPRERVLIKLASTWAGIQAARELEQQGIRTNLTLLFCLAQAKACADAGVQLISPFVGRIYDWFKKTAGQSWDEAAMAGPNDPGVRSVVEIYKHYKRHGIKTEVMAASFRNSGQIIALAGCDLMTISPNLLAELAAASTPVERRLSHDGRIETSPAALTESEFNAALAADAMASEKLGDGIRQFIADTETLEQLIRSCKADMQHDLTLAANALRMLAVDAVQQANSGHPGMPMGMADLAAVLWSRHLRHNPADPQWPGRDRFVLSNGHGSMLLYGLLHLSGYDLPIEELKAFRQLHSKTPGHPEVGLTPGVETTTGPLGQGLANAVGMALAEQLLAAEFNTADHRVVDHRTFVFCGDGCLMEGISHEACSLAGTWGLGKLVVIYDDNGISIDGHVEGWFNDDTPARFEAYGWRVIRDVDGHDFTAIDAALKQASEDVGKPTLICARTVIGKGSPNKAGGHDVHGAPLGTAEVAAVREALNWPHAPFVVPDEARAPLDARARGGAAQREWEAVVAGLPAERAAEFKRRLRGELPAGFDTSCADQLAATIAKAETIASRKASQNSINRLAPALPELLGGSADLAPSNLTQWTGCRSVEKASAGGNYLHYGVREFAMVAIQTGIALHGGFRPFAGTFLMFSEYARNGIRMAALMRSNPIYVFTHDSIGLGEDGPTHQPVEQLATLRLVPNLDVWRPGDAVETLVGWQTAVAHRHTPTCLVLSRQNLPHQERDMETVDAIRRGGYVLVREDKTRPLQLVLIATGSELDLAVKAQAELAGQGVNARVVSLPSCHVFEQQDAAWKRAVLPPGVPRVAVEAGVTAGWRQYVGLEGAVVGIDSFGESAPAAALAAHFGLTVQAVVQAGLGCVSR